MNELRAMCAISREGASAADIKRAADHYGLEVSGWRRSPKDLESIQAPVIIFWDFHHFLVLEGYRNNKFYVNDPANGHRSVDYETFSKSFTGVTLLLEPRDDFQRSEIAPTLRTRLLPWFKHQKRLIVGAALLGLGMTILGLTVPILLGVFVDRVLVSGERAFSHAGCARECANGIDVLDDLDATTMPHSTQSANRGGSGWKFSSRLCCTLPIEFFSQRFPVRSPLEHNWSTRSPTRARHNSPRRSSN